MGVVGVGAEEYDERKVDAAFSSLEEISLFARQRGVEVLLENISQTQIDDDGPYSYAMWARGILRQAPDIVMMGDPLQPLPLLVRC